MTSTTEYQFWIRVIRMAAAVIGATIALWLLSGDRNPEARAQHPESALGRTAEIPPIVAMRGGDVYQQPVVIEHHEQLDRDGVFFFSLVFPSGERLVISTDDGLAIAQWLAHHIGHKVQLTLSDYTTTPNSVGDRKDGSRGE